MTVFCSAAALAQTTSDLVQEPCLGQILRDPNTGQAIVVINSNNNNISVEEASQQAHQLHSGLVKEVNRRYLTRQSPKSQRSFPGASSFLDLYDKIKRMKNQNLFDIKITNPKRILDIHISWLINRHIDFLSQLENTPNNEIKKELDGVYKELNYLRNHPLVDADLQNIISDYLGKVDNNDGHQSLGKPNPDIYFLRGTVAKCCYSNDDALIDFLEGFECLRRDKSQNISDYIIYFPEIRSALSKSWDIKDPVDKNNSNSAKISFEYGYSAFWEGRYSEAVTLFTDAIIDNDRVPIYWYYRALAWKRIGNINNANKDAYNGTRVEREVFGKRTPVVGYMLQRVQGEERKWLEYKRIGYK